MAVVGYSPPYMIGCRLDPNTGEKHFERDQMMAPGCSFVYQLMTLSKETLALICSNDYIFTRILTFNLDIS